MKVGILTYHRVVNDGSVMQAYCLEQLLRSLCPDARVEIIDYRPLRGEINEHRRLFTRRPPWVRLHYWRKLRSVRRFLARHCTFSEQSCVTDNLDVARTFIQMQGYDAVFVGSDTVWEARPSAYAPPFPNVYYLPHLSGLKKIAFAASADPVLPTYAQRASSAAKMREAIEPFDFISVRDEATEDYLAHLGIARNRLRFMPDPTLLHDFSKVAEVPAADEWSTRPLAGLRIGVGSTKTRDKIARAIEQNGYTVIRLSDAGQVDRLLGSRVRTVGQRVGLHAALDLVVTDRFHGSIFALALSQAPVIFVETSAKWPARNSKGRDLFRRLGIEAMVWRYEGGPVSADEMGTHLEVWRSKTSDICARFRSLREVAEGTLSRMMSCLERGKNCHATQLVRM